MSDDIEELHIGPAIEQVLARLGIKLPPINKDETEHGSNTERDNAAA